MENINASRECLKKRVWGILGRKRSVGFDWLLPAFAKNIWLLPPHFLLYLAEFLHWVCILRCAMFVGCSARTRFSGYILPFLYFSYLSYPQAPSNSYQVPGVFFVYLFYLARTDDKNEPKSIEAKRATTATYGSQTSSLKRLAN